MSANSFLRGSIFLSAWIAIGCAPESPFTSLAVVPHEELTQLPASCGSLADVTDEDLGWAQAEGDDTAIVIDTPQGSCVERREAVLTELTEQHRSALVERIASDFAAADPFPHPDLSAGTMERGDPSPHPDKPQGAESSRHSDSDDGDDGDDLDTVVIVANFIGGGGTPGGVGTPAPPPPPAPNKAD